MALQLANVVFDCEDTVAQAGFWSAVLDRPVDPDPSEFFASIGAANAGPVWFFTKVPGG